MPRAMAESSSATCTVQVDDVYTIGYSAVYVLAALLSACVSQDCLFLQKLTIYTMQVV